MNNEYDIAKAFQRIEETLIKSIKRKKKPKETKTPHTGFQFI